MSRSAESTSNTFVCPFADRCGCPVKFRIFATAFSIKLEAQGKHSAESHVQEQVTIFCPFCRPLLFSNANAIVAAARGINSGWPFLAGFNTTFGITSKKLELIGISINSLRRGANPVCLFIVNAKTPARTTSRLHLQPAPRCLPSPA